MPLLNVSIATRWLYESDPAIACIIKPQWRGELAKALDLSPSQRLELRHLYLGKTLMSLARSINGGCETTQKELPYFSVQQLRDDSTVLTRHFTPEEMQSLENPIQRRWLRNTIAHWSIFRAQYDFNDLAEALIQQKAVFTGIRALIKGLRESLTSDHYLNQLTKPLAKNPVELATVANWLDRHGIRSVKLHNHGRSALMLDTDGKYMVRIQSLREPQAVLDAVEVLQPVFSMRSDHFFVNIMPRLQHLKLPRKRVIDDILALRHALADNGIHFWDSHDGNVRYLPDGTPLVVDMGAVARGCGDPPVSRMPLHDTTSVYSWTLPDGTPKQHEFCSWLTDQAPKKTERFKKEALQNGRYRAVETDSWGDFLQNQYQKITPQIDHLLRNAPTIAQPPFTRGTHHGMHVFEIDEIMLIMKRHNPDWPQRQTGFER
jgi:hypothetical protein